MKSYIVNLRESLKDEYRHMPILQDGSAIIVQSEDKILLQRRADRESWGLPGGTQDIGETFEETALRELKEETNLDALINDFQLIAVVSGNSRKNLYPNGDVVYNNTVLFGVEKYTGELKWDFESKEMKFFSIDELPEELMDRDLINVYKKSLFNKR